MNANGQREEKERGSWRLWCGLDLGHMTIAGDLGWKEKGESETTWAECGSPERASGSQNARPQLHDH